MRTINKLSPNGDDTLTYDPMVEADVDLATAFFKQAIEKEGYWGCAIREDGTKDLITDLDVTAPQTVLFPRLVGG